VDNENTSSVEKDDISKQGDLKLSDCLGIHILTWITFGQEPTMMHGGLKPTIKCK